MQRLFSALLLLSALAWAVPVPGLAAQPESLRLLVWVNYLPPWLLEEFTASSGIAVTPSFFADNEGLYDQITSDNGLNRFDVITPSGEMVQRMRQEKLLMPLKSEWLPNKEDIGPTFRNLGFDPGNKESVPLFWGIVGLLLDSKAAPGISPSAITGYADLWRPEFKGKVMLPNDFRTCMSVMLLTLGYSVNEKDPARLQQALDKLKSLAPSVTLFDTVDQESKIKRHKAALSVVWGSESLTDGGDGLHFIFPKEGSPIWVDCLAVPANAPHPEAAHAFINFMLRPDIAARLSAEAGYAVAGVNAKTMVPPATASNPAVYPSDHGARLEAELATIPPDSPLQKQWLKIKSGMYRGE